jgi:hypothetical protein
MHNERMLTREFLRFKRAGMRLLGRLAGPAVLRLSVGSWTKTQGRSWFAAGFAEQAVIMPPLMRGLLALPAGRHMLRVAANYAWHFDRGSLDPAGPPNLGGNLYTAWTAPGLSFLHFEKCGGITVMHWLSQKFHPEQINPDDHRDLPPHLCHRTPRFTGVDPGRYPLIWGHYDLPTLQRFGPAHRVFTVLREPRERLLSLYHFWRSVDPALIDPDLSFSVALAHRLSLEEFLACDDPMLLDLVDNIYVRRLTGRYATGAVADPVHADPRAALDAAFAALRGLAFVGVTEKLDAGLADFAALLGVAPPERGLRANVTAENHTDPSGWFRAVPQSSQTPAVAAALDNRTVLDRAIYAFASAGYSNRPALAAQ